MMEIALRFPHSHRHYGDHYTESNAESRFARPVTYLAGLKCYLSPRLLTGLHLLPDS
jgi:hypothetical protein